MGVNVINRTIVRTQSISLIARRAKLRKRTLCTGERAARETLG